MDTKKDTLKNPSLVYPFFSGMLYCTAFQELNLMSKCVKGHDSVTFLIFIDYESKSRAFNPLSSPEGQQEHGSQSNHHGAPHQGLESPAGYYGVTYNVMAEVLLSRYDLFVSHKMLTHVTTNLNSEELEGIYGNRIRSRMREMFNLLVFNQESNDKRNELIRNR